MINSFEEWTGTLAEYGSLAQLAGATVGIEAADYLNKIPALHVAGVDRKIKEELTVALGGYPLGYKAVVQKTIAIWRKYNITPYFVFSGLDVGRDSVRDGTFQRPEQGVATNAEAWRFYDNVQVAQCLSTFGESTSITAEDTFRYLQQILREEGVEFMVAPYSAWAQLAYLQNVNAVDTIAGSSEIFLYDVPELITKWDFVEDEFTWVKKRACLADLGDVPSEVFVDACLLAGISVLPALPQLESKRSPKVRSAAEMILGMGRTGHSVCLQYQDTPQLRQSNYLDRFRKAKTILNHHVVMTVDGQVTPSDANHAPGDLHELVSQRLPEELYFYLSKGIIGPRVLNWRVHGEIIEAPPLDNGESEEYRKLVSSQLTEMRTSTLALMSHSLHRVFMHKDLALRCWFDKDKAEPISMRYLEDPRPLVNSWHVPASVFHKKSYPDNNLLGFAVRALADTEFAAQTIGAKKQGQPLKTKEELLVNSIWRFLHLRGYIDNNHNLTKWGVALNAAMSALPSREYEGAALIAMELARLGLLGADYMFPTYSGLSYANSEVLRRNILLVSRVATLGQLRHHQIGFTGALSRHLLGWHSMISAVRSSLRDLLEVCMVTLLLNGDADREREDWTDLGLDLPFLLDHGCAMGLAMNIYLNKVVELPDPQSEESRQAAMENGQKSVFVHCMDFEADIEQAFGLWDAVYNGIQAAELPAKNKKLFEEVNSWVKDLR